MLRKDIVEKIFNNQDNKTVHMFQLVSHTSLII